MFCSFLTSKLSLASRSAQEMTISLSHSPTGGKHSCIITILGLSLCSCVHAPCICTHVPYVQKPKDSWGACFYKIMTKAHLIRGGGGLVSRASPSYSKRERGSGERSYFRLSLGRVYDLPMKLQSQVTWPHNCARALNTFSEQHKARHTEAYLHTRLCKTCSLLPSLSPGSGSSTNKALLTSVRNIYPWIATKCALLNAYFVVKTSCSMTLFAFHWDKRK